MGWQTDHLRARFLLDDVHGEKKYLKKLDKFESRKKTSSLEYYCYRPPFIAETPMDVSSETPRFSHRRHPYFRWRMETPNFSLETPMLLWRPHIFIRDPQIFIGDSRFSLDTPNFRWRTPYFSLETPYFLWRSPY